jgi:hypothetical protein
VQCRKCKEKFTGNKLLARIRASPCRGWRLVRDGKLCYAASIKEVAPRFSASTSAAVTGGWSGTTVSAGMPPRPTARAHDLDDPEGHDGFHSEGEPWDDELPRCPSPEPLESEVEAPRGTGLLAVPLLGRAPTRDRLSGRTAAEALWALPRAQQLSVLSGAFERASVDRANVTGIARKVHGTHVIGAALDAVFCWRCGAHSFGARFVLLREGCRAPSAAGSAFLGGVRASGEDFLQRTADQRRKLAAARHSEQQRLRELASMPS